MKCLILLLLWIATLKVFANQTEIGINETSLNQTKNGMKEPQISEKWKNVSEKFQNISDQLQALLLNHSRNDSISANYTNCKTIVDSSIAEINRNILNQSLFGFKVRQNFQLIQQNCEGLNSEFKSFLNPADPKQNQFLKLKNLLLKIGYDSVDWEQVEKKYNLLLSIFYKTWHVILSQFPDDINNIVALYNNLKKQLHIGWDIRSFIESQTLTLHYFQNYLRPLNFEFLRKPSKSPNFEKIKQILLKGVENDIKEISEMLPLENEYAYWENFAAKVTDWKMVKAKIQPISYKIYKLFIKFLNQLPSNITKSEADDCKTRHFNSNINFLKEAINLKTFSQRDLKIWLEFLESNDLYCKNDFRDLADKLQFKPNVAEILTQFRISDFKLIFDQLPSKHKNDEVGKAEDMPTNRVGYAIYNDSDDDE